MITRMLILAIFIFIPTVSSSAEDTSSLDNTLKGVASDLAQLQNEIENAYKKEAGIYPYDGYLVPASYYVTITNEKSRLRVGADDSAPVLMKASKGASYKVVDKVSDWYAVALDKPKKGIESAWVSAADVAPKYTIRGTTSSEKSVTEKIYESIMESVKKIRDKYQSDPYVSVSGFSINIGVPPSVSVSFEFKQ